MDSYKHQLQKYSGSGSRYKCPKCQKTGKFVRFIDTESGKQIADNVGKCERINSCGYILKPGDYLYNTGSNNKSNQNVTIYSKQVEISLIPEPLFQKSFVREKSFQQLTEANSLVKFMSDKFGSETVEPVIRKYFIGTSKYRWKRHNYISEPGATVFYQVDGFNRVRTGKIMLYDPNTGERIKEPFNHIQWVHKLLDNKDYNLQQCLFGEHLLKEDNTSPVAITESEKTALFASLYYPQFIWLATGGVENFKLIEKSVSLLKRRKVHLFPDLGQYELWHTKALNMGSKNIRVIDLLEEIATPEDKIKGLDLADYLLKFPIDRFKPDEKSLSDIGSSAEIHTINFKYLDEVLLYLIENRSKIINIKARPNPDKFTEGCKRLIDYGIASFYNLELTFSNDFQKLKIA